MLVGVRLLAIDDDDDEEQRRVKVEERRRHIPTSQYNVTGEVAARALRFTWPRVFPCGFSTRTMVYPRTLYS